MGVIFLWNNPTDPKGGSPGRKVVGHWTIIRAVVTPYPKFIPSHPTKELKIWTLSPWWRQSVFSEYSTNLFVSTQATGKGKLKGFHLNGDQVPFQNTLLNLFVSTQATKERKIERLLPWWRLVSFQNTLTIFFCFHIGHKRTEIWKAFTGMATKCLFKILNQIHLFPHRSQKN